MIAVLDVSAAVEMLLKKEKSNKFNELFEEASWIIAPDLYVSEISNVFWKYYKAQLLSFEDCIQYAEDGIALVDDFFDSRDLWKEVLGEGMKNEHSVYDMFYAVLARRNEGTLITNDKQLASVCKKLKISFCN
jgi:predicted nucleic acid-binding protein